MLFRISQKNPSLCSLLFFLCLSLLLYSIVPIANNTMHKSCNVKLQAVNILLLFYYGFYARLYILHYSALFWNSKQPQNSLNYSRIIP